MRGLWSFAGRRLFKRTGKSIRGRVSRVSIIRGGEVSVVVRFGLEERDRVQAFTPGTLLELVEMQVQDWKFQPFDPDKRVAGGLNKVAPVVLPNPETADPAQHEVEVRTIQREEGAG